MLLHKLLLHGEKLCVCVIEDLGSRSEMED